MLDKKLGGHFSHVTLLCPFLNISIGAIVLILQVVSVPVVMINVSRNNFYGEKLLASSGEIVGLKP